MSVSGTASAIAKSPEPDQANEELPNQISAAYEVPQFPIEQIEKKLLLQRHLTAKWVWELSQSQVMYHIFVTLRTTLETLLFYDLHNHNALGKREI